MEDLHRIPISKIDDMLAALFPSVYSTVVRAVVEKLNSNGDTGAQGRWKVFDVEPSKQTGIQDNGYNKGLLDTFNQMNSAASSRTTNTHVPMALKETGNETPRSERTNASRPDGCFHLQFSKIPLQDYCALELGPGQTHWADIICPIEFKNIDER